MDESPQNALQEAIKQRESILKQKETEYNNLQNEISTLRQQNETTTNSLNSEIANLTKRLSEGNSMLITISNGSQKRN